MALTPEQQKEIRIARQIAWNVMEHEFMPLMKQYVEWQREVQELHRGAPWAPKPKPAAPQIDPAEQKALQEVLAEASEKKETK
jgi:hypothetical protein